MRVHRGSYTLTKNKTNKKETWLFSVSNDDFRYGPHPQSWNNQYERFFFTRPSRRRKPNRPRQKFFVGDPSQCITGSCEFFLFCWLGGGVVEGDCGGFLMSCCNRPNKVGHKTIVIQVGPKDSSSFFFECIVITYYHP